MGQISRSRMIEIVAMAVVVVSVGLNVAVILVVAKQLRAKASLGLKMVLAVAAFDLLGPAVGIVQEILNVTLQFNVLTGSGTCQMLGAIHSVIPLMSATAVALVALERSLCVYNRPLRPRTYLRLALATLAGASVLALLTASDGAFELQPCRLACSMSPRRGVVGAVYFYAFVALLVLDALVIAGCYTSIICLRFTPSLTIASTGSSLDMPCAQRRRPRGFVLRAAVIMASYLLLLVPCVLLMAREAYTGRALSHLQSSVFTMALFSFTLVNPILLIVLHTSISRAFCWLFRFAKS